MWFDGLALGVQNNILVSGATLVDVGPIDFAVFVTVQVR